MFNRRDILKGTCATCATAAVACAEPAYNGCTLTSFDVAAVANASDTQSLATPAQFGGEGGAFGSGNPAFDRALSLTLASISQAFSVLPGFVFSERVMMNAFATQRTSLGRQDGSVVFGRPLYREIMNRGEHPEIGIVAVCAHEFGHIAQYKHNLQYTLIVNGMVKRLELHADFMAGYFAGRRKLESPDFPAAVFATTQYSFGDSDYGAPDHHGTKTERGQAVVKGFETAYSAQQSFEMALQTGVSYVQQIPL